MSDNKGYERTDRVSQKLQEIMGRLILTKVRDPRVNNIEITDVEVTADLGRATIYYMPLQEDADREEIGRGLEQASGYLRGLVADRLDTKFVPELEFEFDESIERGRRIEELLSDVDSEAESTDGDETEES